MQDDDVSSKSVFWKIVEISDSEFSLDYFVVTPTERMEQSNVVVVAVQERTHHIIEFLCSCCNCLE